MTQQPTVSAAPAVDDEAPVRLSVVIPCLNEERVIGEQLGALAAQRWAAPWEVIVADNGSTDGTCAVVDHFRGYLPRLRLVEASARRGAAYAMNEGVRAARAPAIAFCDADDMVGVGWVRAMGEALTAHAFVAGRFEETRLNAPWAAASRPNPQADGLQQKHYLPYAGAGNMGVRRAVFEAVGGFDDGIRHLFDVDFCWRVQEQTGVPLTYVPEAVLHVRYRHTLWAIFQQARHYARAKHLLLEHYGLRDAPDPPTWREWVTMMRVTLGALRRARSRGELGRWAWQGGWRVGVLQHRNRTERPLLMRPPGRKETAVLTP